MRFLPIAPFLLLPLSLNAQQRVPAPAPEHVIRLPVTHVSLYKNGVGFFEHTGHVTGNAQVTIPFTSAQLNDVLQSLTALDLNGGHITGAGYNSTTPLDQQLRNLPLTLNDNPTIASFYTALRGARLEVDAGAIHFTGRLLSVETGDAISAPVTGPQAASSPEKLLLTLVADSGEVRTLVVTATTSVRVIDPRLHNDVSRYLQLLDANRSQGLRHLTLSDNGSGTRELRVSYISEVPIWKSTYRILVTPDRETATVQGWSVVDNTTGTDWTDVKLSLIAGTPQSFIQPLSQPIYSRRPEIPIAQQSQLSPQTYASAFTSGTAGSGLAGVVTDASGASIPNATITAVNMATGHRETSTTDSQGRFSFPLAAGNYTVEASSPGFNQLRVNNVTVDGNTYVNVNTKLQVGSVVDTVEVTATESLMNTESASMASVTNGLTIPNEYKSRSLHGGAGYAAKAPLVAMPAPPPPPPFSYENAAAGSFTSNTQASGFDDFFAYNIDQPVTIRKNESALVPILQATLPAESVTLVHAEIGGSLSQPLRALWLTNSTDLTLDSGSFAVVEAGQFGGEGLLDPIHPKEKRLVSYAADQAIHVTTENTSGSSHVVRITAADGTLRIQQAERQSTTYLVRNAATESRTVILEHPVRSGFVLDAASKPDETAADVYRFRVTLPSGQTVRLPVNANHENVSVFELTEDSDAVFANIALQSGNNAKLNAALQPIVDARRKSAAADAAVDATQTKLDNLHHDEDRERANITALNNADKASRDRFVRDLNDTEDAIRATQAELDSKTAAKDAADAEVDRIVGSFTFDESL